MRIIARTSTFAARERELSLAQITEQMKVTHALEGSVRRAGTRIRVTARLFTTSDQTQLWSERYDREIRDIFEVQDEIARAVAEQQIVRLDVAGRLLHQRRVRGRRDKLEADGCKRPRSTCARRSRWTRAAPTRMR